MYIACKTQSNIVFMIECLSQNLIDVKIEHIKAAKWVMWYLKKTMNYNWKYKSKLKICMNQINTVAYSYLNSNYAENITDWKFIINYIFMLNNDVAT